METEIAPLRLQSLSSRSIFCYASKYLESGDPVTKSNNLPSLDLGRFAAAFLVVLFHSSFTVFNIVGKQPFDMALRGGHSGVEYFFVLSGFIIMYIHRRDGGHPKQLAGFARKRVIRIIPMLWLVLIPWGILKLTVPAMGTNEPITPFGFVCDLLLLPHSGGTVLGVTWTLLREAVFYLIFATFILNRRVGLGLLIAWQIGVVAQMVHPFFALGVQPGMLLGTVNIGFGAGMLIAWFMPNRVTNLGAPIITVGAALYAALLFVEWRIGGPVSLDYRPMGLILNPLLYTGAAAVLVVGMVAYDFSRPRASSALSKILGGSSYTLYLVHLPVGSVLIRAIKPLWHRVPSEALMIILASASVLVAIGVHVWIERPILEWLRSRVPKRAAVSPVTVASEA